MASKLVALGGAALALLMVSSMLDSSRRPPPQRWPRVGRWRPSLRAHAPLLRRRASSVPSSSLPSQARIYRGTSRLRRLLLRRGVLLAEAQSALHRQPLLVGPLQRLHQRLRLLSAASWPGSDGAARPPRKTTPVRSPRSTQLGRRPVQAWRTRASFPQPSTAACVGGQKGRWCGQPLSHRPRLRVSRQASRQLSPAGATLRRGLLPGGCSSSIRKTLALGSSGGAGLLVDIASS